MRWDTKAYKVRLHRYMKRLRAIKVWQLVVLLLLSLIVNVILLRLNSLNMSDLRHAVIVADQKGDDAATNKAVVALGQYVGAHMHTELNGRLYLLDSYDRAREAAVRAAADTNSTGSAAYQQASVICQNASARVPFGGLYVPCVLDKVKALGGTDETISKLNLPPVALYKVDFVSPVWSPDPAGISVAISALISLMIFVRVTGAIILRLLLKRYFTSI